MRAPIWSILAFVVGCGGPKASPPPPVTPATPVATPVAPTPPAPPPSPEPPKLRLGTHVKPTHYALELAIVPTEETFSGKVTIALAVDEPTPVIWLHADELAIDSVELDHAPAHVLPATKAMTDAKVIGIAPDGLVRIGTAELVIAYHAKLSALESRGLYKQEDRGNWYAYTQFEATDARRAFPCFDEPSFKVPFAVSLKVKQEDVAVANAPMTGETPDGNGMKLVRFAETKPLPTYLVAFAVGPFDVVDGGTGGKNKVPLRIIATKGRAAEAAYATKATPQILAQLEDYFGIPYPYEKLDQIAVPRKGGAMENAGLVTYGLPIILVSAAEDTPRRRRSFAGIAAHELAHQWFGDLVTLAWWDDIWLNESFASWMEDVVLAKWQPTWGSDVDVVQRKSGAMRGDLLTTARRIRQPIESEHDISAAFDGITYSKGSSIIAMIEAWLGPAELQRAVRQYLAAHAYGVATTKDFLASVGAVAPTDVVPVFSSFLDQTGVPLVDIDLKCEAGKKPTIALAQSRYTPIGARDSAPQTWHVPVCVKFGTGDKAAGRACMTLDAATGELELPTTTCPAWVLGNAGELGYYRVRYRGDLLDKLLATRALTRPERIGVYGDLAALVDAGHIGVDKALALVPALAKESDRHLVSQASGFVGYLNDDVVPPALRPNRARFIRKMFGDRARSLGWAAISGESDDNRLQRPGMLSMVAHCGEDPGLAATAKTLAAKWLADHKSVDPEVVGLALELAANHGDRAFYDKLHALAKAEKERRERQQLLGAMSDFKDPEIVKLSLAIPLTDEFDIREAMTLIWGAFEHDETREMAYAFVKEHLDALLAKLPKDSGAGFIRIGSSFCDEAHRADLEAFFKDRAPTYLGGPRALAQTLERLDLCIARKKAREAPIAAFLAKW